MKLQRLKELALGATQGGWVYFPKPKYREHHVSVPIEGSTSLCGLFQDGCPTENAESDAAYIAAACPANILPFIESYEELLAAAKGYLDNSVRDIGRQGRQAHGALLQAITNAEKLNHE